jgi:hypothetical protein
MNSTLKLIFLSSTLVSAAIPAQAQSAAETFCAKLNAAIIDCGNEATAMKGRCPGTMDLAMLEYSRAIRGAVSDGEKKGIENIYAQWIEVANQIDPKSIDPASDPYQDRWAKMVQEFQLACRRMKPGN